MRYKELCKLNEEFYNNNKDKYNNFLHMGFFNNNHILIIGQNPGNPWSAEQKQFVDDLNNEKDYNIRELKYFNIIKNTKITEYLNKVFGYNWKHISYTNLVKTVTVNNEEPSQELVNDFKDILDKQIKLLNPTLVVCLGKFVGSRYGLNKFYDINKIDNTFYIMIPHPSYWDYNGKNIYLIDEIKSNLDRFLKFHALIKVNHNTIYYRNEEFKKCTYVNTEYNDFCFIKSENKTDYKSFDGYYLEKVKRSSTLLLSDTLTYEKHLTKKDLFYYNNINKISHSKMVRYMLFDIENDFSNDVVTTPKPITTISFYDNLENKFYCYVNKFNRNQEIKKHEYAEIKDFNSEKEMLESFLNTAGDYDVLSGWYSDGFDIPYLLRRCNLIGIDLTLFFNNMWIDNNSVDEFRVYCDSHIFYDALSIYQRTIYFNKPPSFSLDAVSKHLFKDEGGKLEHDSPDVLWREDINHLINYNIQDVKLLKMIVDHSNLINYPLLLQTFCPQDFENVFYNSKTIENLLHHRYWNKNIFFPTKTDHEKPEFEGALVLEPVAGLHYNVAAFDFSAMYTNIYLSFNFSPDTLVGEKKHVKDNIDSVLKDLRNRYPELIKFLNKDTFLKECILIKNDFGEYYFLPSEWKIGILPSLEREMLDMRKYYTDIRDSYKGDSEEYKIFDEIQGLAKTILNSIYGVVGYKRFILFNPIIPASITSAARQLNVWVQNKCKEKEYMPLYGDTDSIFIKFKVTLDFESFIKEVQEFNIYLNESFKDFMKMFTLNIYTINNQTNKLEFEKAYLKLRLTNVKKRYFGSVKYYKGKILNNPEIKVVGFETRRNDTPPYFQKILKEVYILFLEDDYVEKIRDYYKNIKKDIKNQNVEDLIIKIKLSRNVDTYVKVIPMHVRALRNSNSEVKRGQYVNMVHVKNKQEIVHVDENDKSDINIDYDKYLEKFFIDKVHLIDKNIHFHTTLSDFFWKGDKK